MVEGCSTDPQKNQLSNVAADSSQSKSTSSQLPALSGTHYWTGNINTNIPIFIRITIKHELVNGEVTYLKSSNPTPILLLGQVDKKRRDQSL